MKHRYGTPLLMMNGEGAALQRFQFQEKTLDESWIQQILHETPTVLPVREIAEEFAPLISLGREVQTAAGYIDNLFISPGGYLTVVETKLWRNPQAMREVVAQILDYAKELITWETDDLDTAIKRNCNGKGLADIVNKAGDWSADDEIAFLNAVAKNLRLGRFLLLVVGDGIRDNLERMLDYLNQTPQIQFSFAMVELKIYETTGPGDKVRLVVPTIRSKTQEVIRGIVKVETRDPEVKVTVEMAKDEVDGDRPKRKTMRREEFLDGLREQIGQESVAQLEEILQAFDDLGLVIRERAASLTVRMPERANKNLFSLLEFNKNGNVAVSGYFSWHISEAGLPETLVSHFFKRMKPIFGGKLPKGYKQYGIPVKEVLTHRDELLAGLEATMEEVWQAQETQDQ